MKTYRKVATIQAEQFDGSKEMINRYDIKNKLNKYFIPTSEGDMEMSVGYWIATGNNGDHWAISNEYFKKNYVEDN